MTKCRGPLQVYKEKKCFTSKYDLVKKRRETGNRIQFQSVMDAVHVNSTQGQT